MANTDSTSGFILAGSFFLASESWKSILSLFSVMYIWKFSYIFNLMGQMYKIFVHTLGVPMHSCLQAEKESKYL